MKLLLQADWQADNMTAPVKQAIQQFAWKGQDVWRENVTLNWLQLQRDLTYIDYTPIGTVEFVKSFAEKIGVKLPDPIHATELLQLEGRLYATVESKDSIHKATYPFFVKPFKELKKFTGFVVKSEKDFELYPDVEWSNTSLFLTGVLENIVSEWRCYVLNGKVFACVNYSGDPLKFPNPAAIRNCIENFTSAPIAYSLDMAITDHTQFIEINDAYALGYYGGDIELYTKMLNERWKEIIKNQ